MTSLKFSSSTEEIKYWRELAHKYKDSFESVKEELDDFQTSSKELETELETQLTQTEDRNKELISANSRLQTEVETLREKLDKLTSNSYKQINELELKISKSESFSDRLQKYIRELEQTNDDLERTKRAAVVSLEDFEGRLNQAIERNAFLESELDEKDELVECVQRLKDEGRDLRHELAVHSKDDVMPKIENEEIEKMEIDTLDTRGPNNTQPNVVNNTTMIKDEPIEIVRLKTEEVTPARNESFMLSSPINPSTRISALNIVSDLLRKVGALESKLNSNRGSMLCSTQQQQQTSIGRTRERNASPSNSPSSKRINVSKVQATAPLGSPGGASQSGFIQITV